MAYLDRLKECKYISPSGKEYTLFYDELARTNTKKAAIIEMPYQNNPEVFDLGETGVKYSVKLYFLGADYDLSADAFWNALSESGPARFINPRWGEKVVLCTSKGQNESFVEGMGKATFDLEFIVISDFQVELSFPVSALGSIASAISAFADGVDAFTEYLQNSVVFRTAKELIVARDMITQAINKTIMSLGALCNGVQEFTDTANEILNNTDEMIADPGSFNGTLDRLMSIAAKQDMSITTKVRSFASLLDSINTDLQADLGSTASLLASIRNAAFVNGCRSVFKGTVTKRDEAVNALIDLTDFRETYLQNIADDENNVEDFSFPFGVLNAYRRGATLASASLLNKAFSARLELVKTLTRDATPLDLVVELYGSLDNLDSFIEQNELQGTDFFFLPSGRVVRYYAV